MQRLEVLIAVMLARERRSPWTYAAATGCTALAAALAALPSRPLEMVAEAVAGLGFQLGGKHIYRSRPHNETRPSSSLDAEPS